MSRGGGGRGGRGGGRGGRGGFGGQNNAPPMGLTFADIQSLSREATALYPSFTVPVFTEPSNDEKRIAELQLDYAARMRRSQYYIVEKTKSTELERYSDKYRPSATAQPTLKREELHAPFFPKELLEDHFNPRRSKKAGMGHVLKKIQLNLDEFNDDVDEEEKSGDDRSDAGSRQESDYDVDEEFDNDYAENHFDNGEGDDMDDLGGGGGGDDGGGGGGDYD